MAISYLGNRGSGSGISAVFASISPSQIVLAGDLLIIAIEAFNAVQILNDTQGNVWQVDASSTNGGITASICSSVLAFELQPADTIMVIGLGLSGSFDYNLEEFSGIASPAWKDKNASNTGTGTALDSGTTTTTSQANELCVAAFGINKAEGSFTPGGTYSPFGIVNHGASAILGEFLIVSSTGTQNATATVDVSGTWAGAIATYKAGAASPEEYGPAPYLTR